jgi:superfamily II DNA/RNA helicase
VHRIGRTARAGAHGIAVTFVDWDELARWKMINQVLELGLAEPEETYSSSEHLYETLNIPTGSTGRLVKAKPVAKVESKEARAPRAKQEAAPVRAERTERARTRTKKFKES